MHWTFIRHLAVWGVEVDILNATITEIANNNYIKV